MRDSTVVQRKIVKVLTEKDGEKGLRVLFIRSKPFEIGN